jgi:hypothetical protein
MPAPVRLSGAIELHLRLRLRLGFGRALHSGGLWWGLSGRRCDQQSGL